MNRLLQVLVAGLLVQGVSRASTSVPEQRLKTAVSEVLTAAKASTNPGGLAGKLQPILEQYLSFEAMTRRAVGPGWREFSSSQKRDAKKLFTTLIIRTYSSKFTPGQDPQILFNKAATPAPGRVEIPTTILYQGSKYGVTYRMEESEGWKITDVVIEGVSLVANYRTQFDGEFKKGGAKAVVDSLTQAVAQK
ncbi:MAG: ABC transporter substrate-binding protein [Terrimicrobiaceae bacterium]